MGGRNGGAMGKRSTGKKNREKKNNVLTMLPKEFGDDAAVENCEETAAEKKPRNGKRKTTEKEDKKERKKSGKGARKALRHAVKKEVKENCGPIAARLVKKAESGDMRSADMVLA